MSIQWKLLVKNKDMPTIVIGLS